MSNTSGPLPGLPNAASPVRTIALQRLKLNVPVLVAFYVWIHSDFYTYILKRSFGIKLMQMLLNIWEVGQGSRIKNGTSEAARKEKANDAFEWLFETPIYAILVFNILQALYALYTNATATQLLKLDTNHSTGTAPVAAPAPGPNPNTRVRASLTRAIPDSPSSHPSFPTTMSSDSLRRRLARQSEKSPQEQPQHRQVQKSGDTTVAQTSQSSTAKPAIGSSQSAPASSSSLPLSRLLQTQSQLSSSQGLRPSLGVLAPGPNPYLSRSGLESPTQTTGFSLLTPAQPQPTDDELFGSLRRTTSRRRAVHSNMENLGGISADALQSYRARHQLVQDGTLGRSTAGSAVDRARALEIDVGEEEGDPSASDLQPGQQRQMITA
ncbi:hypothetical protein QFC22_001293 [Naganishia vaughanmartiniae]|uniref:Uncharacterized protein n=1 Tax=Naganishia vaughanmartiniae TaxID=1424756 RepID=A0ACC2XGZ7_9TREE|nr:hypothetical protein QFC22_001293 [Naganishia vaughanmartiniae]